MLLKTTTPADGAGAGDTTFEKAAKLQRSLYQPPQKNPSGPAPGPLAQLSATFPVIAEYRPLAIGIHRALLAAMPGTSNKIIRRAIALHCGRRRYLEVLVAGGPRYALDGSVCGEVTELQREVARARLEQARKLEAPVPKLPALRLPTRPILSLAKRRGGAS